MSPFLPPLPSKRWLTETALCHTLLYMKTATLSIRLDDDLDRLLIKASRQAGRSRSEVARDALRRQLRLTQFEAIRRRMMPFAEARGFLTDEDVFDKFS
ncbi:MAG: ribbon-helix-helix protein, CopG family [Kiritimatiellia bacterium]